MQKLFKNSKQILAFVFAVAILAASLFAGGFNITADACDVTKIDYWDGTAKEIDTTAHAGTAEDPYIIENAEQLAFVALQRTSAVDGKGTGKYYKLSDNLDILVMQPDTVVTDLNRLINLDSAQAVKTYFETLKAEGKDVKNWLSLFLGYSFNGNFDGNGVTIYGLYVDTDGTTREDIGLFPQYDGGINTNGVITPNVCKNIAVKNSYYHSKRRMGAIAGAAYGTNYGAKVDGKVIIDTCAVENCYMWGTADTVNKYMEQGIVVGGGNMDIIEVNNVLVKGVYAFDTEQNKNIGIIGSASNKKIPDPNDTSKTIYQTKVTNSIFIGSAPYRKDYFTNEVCEPHIFTNVFTDAEITNVELTNPPSWQTAKSIRDYSGHISKITQTGYAFQKSAAVLDWKNTWFMSENGPELRKFHGEIQVVTTSTTHNFKCADCGIESPKVDNEHAFVKTAEAVYECSICGYACAHDSVNTVDKKGDCVTDTGTNIICNYCSYTTIVPTEIATGHKFKHYAEDAGNCEVNGHKEYWHCEVCDKKFISDDVMTPMDAAVTDEWLDTGLGEHIKKENDKGVIIFYDEYGHWYECSVDDGHLDFDSNVIPNDEPIEHVFEKGGSECLDCDFVCKQHKIKEINVEVVGDCFTDEKSRVGCEFCDYKAVAITRPAGHDIIKQNEILPNDREEGTKAHYKCDRCNELFADAEGKTPVTRAALVIPKTISAEYQNLIVDSSGKSPATSDNFASVLSIAALAGVALIAIRKK